MYVYLASPYTAPAPSLMEARYHLALKATAEIAAARIPIYSPIVSWHEVARQCKLPTDADFWWQQDRAMIRHCCELWVLTIPGYERSNGVKMEITFASALQLPVRYGLHMESLIREFKLNHPTIAGASND